MINLKLNYKWLKHIPKYSHKNSNDFYVSKSAGYSLPELLTIVAIVGIMAAIAIPSFSETIQNSRVKELSSNFSFALYLAQSEAVKRGVQVSVEPKQSSGNEWQSGWNIFVDPNGNGTLDAGEELINSHDMAENGLTLVSNNSVFSSWIAFLPSSGSRGNGALSGSFRICRPDSDITKSRSINVHASGNIIIDKGTLTCP